MTSCLPDIDSEMEEFQNVIKESHDSKDKQKLNYEPVFDDHHSQKIQEIK